MLALEVTIEMLPLTLPVAAGVNATLKGVLAPADKVTGSVSPLIVNVEGVTVTWETVALPLPAAVKLAAWVPVLPTITLPTFNGDDGTLR